MVENDDQGLSILYCTRGSNGISSRVLSSLVFKKEENG